MMPNLPAPVTRLNLRLLQTFMLVAEHSSFREAAEQTLRSQSAVSSQVKQLETQLGITLLHRTTRSVRLTSEGAELFAGIKRAMHEVNLGLRKIQESVDMKRGRVALACSPTVAATRLPHILSVFEQDYPEVRVSLTELHSADIFNVVRQGDADFGIGPMLKAVGDDIHYEPILDDPLMALVPRAFLANARKTISLQDLVAMPLLLHSTGTAMRQLLEDALQARQLKLESKYQCMQMQTLVAMAGAGLGAAILPRSVLSGAQVREAQALRIVEPTMSRQVAIITVRGRELSPAAARLAQLVRELIDEDSAPPKERSVRRTRINRPN